MATNKRKESAALFELIDKSTLKVPKSAGSLKIPNWWSSKTNPATVPENAPAPLPQVGAPAFPTPPHTIPSSSPGASSAATTVVHADTAVAGTPVEEAPVQHRLFDPPPANVAPPTSPSIRPPMGGVTPVHMAPAVVPPAVNPAAKVVSSSSKPERSAEVPAAPPARRVFAPQTYAQDRKAWSSPRPGAFARLPLWAIISGAVLLVIVVCAIVIAAQGRRKTQTNGGNPTATAAATQGMNSTSPTVIFGRGVAPAPGMLPAGKVYEGGTVARAPERYYIIVCSTPAQSAAQDSAKFLAAHGVDCSIERVGTGSDQMYWLVSVQGYPSITAAQLYLKKIIDIGNLMSPNAPNPWKTAFPRNGLTSPGSSPARSGTR